MGTNNIIQIMAKYWIEKESYTTHQHQKACSGRDFLISGTFYLQNGFFCPLKSLLLLLAASPVRTFLWGLQPARQTRVPRQPAYNQLPLWGKSIQQPAGVAAPQRRLGSDGSADSRQPPLSCQTPTHFTKICLTSILKVKSC